MQTRSGKLRNLRPKISLLQVNRMNRKMMSGSLILGIVLITIVFFSCEENDKSGEENKIGPCKSIISTEDLSDSDVLWQIQGCEDAGINIEVQTALHSDDYFWWYVSGLYQSDSSPDYSYAANADGNECYETLNNGFFEMSQHLSECSNSVVFQMINTKPEKPFSPAGNPGVLCKLVVYVDPFPVDCEPIND
jgi:hypothetical protein